MANRSSIYSLSNRPTSFYDRPETISGLSEFPYFVPFTYHVLMSGNPQPCASLISDGLDSDRKDRKTKLYAISSEFDPGFARLEKLFSILRPIVAETSANLASSITSTLEFLGTHANRYLLLETIELDTIAYNNEEDLRLCVDDQIRHIRSVGAAIDSLPSDITMAGKLIIEASQNKFRYPLNVFYGLRFDDYFDHTRDEKTKYPLGLCWYEELYFQLWDKEKFEALQDQNDSEDESEEDGDECSYIYSLSNRPTSYEDLPESISGLSECPYYVPFTYRVLMSGNPQICASLITNGFDSDTEENRTKIHAISSEFNIGFTRLVKFFSTLRTLIAYNSPGLASKLDQTIEFLSKHSNDYLLLETIQLDYRSHSEEAELKACVESEIERIRAVGIAIDALPPDLKEAGIILKAATDNKNEYPFDAFYGLRLDNYCDNTQDKMTKYPLGLWWDEDIYFNIEGEAEN